jgi:mannobiose 2-epimerase
MTQSFANSEFRQQLENELAENILPFWMTKVVDKVNGGFYGAVTNDLKILNDVPRSAILCARILWTYAAAYRRGGEDQYLSTARWAYDYLTEVFWDHKFGGVYWSVDVNGSPVFDRKHHYAQAFAIYGLSEYHRATQEPKSLELAKTSFQLLEEYAYDPTHQGYIEGSSRDWGTLEDMRLSDKDLNCHKSMNTMLHILEAYTNLLRVWDDVDLKAKHKGLIEVFQNQIIDHQIDHFKLFFDEGWNSLSEHVSFGHDIEGSWLLWEAVEMHDDSKLSAQVRESTMSLASAVYQEGLDDDGSLFHEAKPDGIIDPGKEWWTQAEAIVGFYNAYQLTGKEHFAQAAYKLWSYIQTHMIDKENGDWFKRLYRDGTPETERHKAGPWDCPYHHARLCFEMIDRLER